jgi:hypothetical protein
MLKDLSALIRGGVAFVLTATVETPETEAIFYRICSMYAVRSSRD